MKRVEHPWALTPDQVILETGSSANGLAAESARQRLMEAGPNLLRDKARDPWWVLFARQFANPLVYMLIGAAAVKAYFKGPVDAAVIGAVLLSMAVIGFAQEMKARRAMAALLSLSAPKAKVRRDGAALLVDAAAVVPGDLLVLEAGDRVAADARLFDSASLRINESTFTGESMPVEKGIRAVSADAAIHDRTNMLFMGTTVSHGRGVAVVTATGMNTEIGRIADAISTAKKDKTPLQHSIEKLGHALIWVVSGACLLLAAAGLLQGMGWVDVLLLAVAAAVSGIPEGLPASVTVILSICVSRMAARNVIIRKLTAVETLGTATIICSDKTGTLTLNQMTVRGVWVDGRHLSVSGNGYEPEGEFRDDSASIDPQSDGELRRLLRVGALCNDALLNRTDGKWVVLGDPTEGALLAAAGKAGMRKADLETSYPRLGEIPFESENQFMATLHADEGVRTVFVKGSVERLLSLCATVRTAGGERPLNEEERREVLRANERMAGQAWRVLAIAAAPYNLELGRLDAANLAGRLTLLGLVGMIDPPRDEARAAIQACRRAGIRVAMITGDNPLTAAAIAAQLGICDTCDTALTGRDIETMSDDDLLTACRTHNVYARIEPLHKLRIVEAFKRDGHIAAMTGDGVNDAPALEAAGIGVAMGITGTDVAKEAADMVLADDNFASIVAAVEEGRIIFNRLRNVTFFLLMTCLSELLTLFLSVAFYGESPLEPIQILWINLVTGSMAAIPLGLEPGVGDELDKPPRDPSVGLLYPGLILRLIAVGLCMSIPVTWIFHHAPLPEADPVTAHRIRQTIAFTSIVVFEWLFAFQSRSPDRGVFQLGLLRNRWLVRNMLLGLGMQMLVVYLPMANRVFHTHPLTLVEWMWCLIPGMVAFSLEATRKQLAPNLFARGQWGSSVARYSLTARVEVNSGP
ncbi:MAG: HAD-IC family P-type ATPase [Candidatus Eisenbacteria bacterium]|jgi:Ca2+-transporting ATPase|nr:HAD-IC family P-type ATPase [Candidatus Eisenbacteria bacterium]